jgi:hypothetical protein
MSGVRYGPNTANTLKKKDMEGILQRENPSIQGKAMRI